MASNEELSNDAHVDFAICIRAVRRRLVTAPANFQMKRKPKNAIKI